ncbi:MAG: SDR family oxidoreductase [Myxococcota bacterium]
MGPLNLSGKNAFVTGVSDDVGFGWHIAKALKAAGASVYLACHPRVLSIVERILTRGKNAEARQLPYGAQGEFQPDGMFGCDVEYDHWDEIPDDKRKMKGYQEQDVSIEGAMKRFDALTGGDLDILIHSVAFSPEIQKSHIEVSRHAYLQAMSVSAYSLVALTQAGLSRFRPGGSAVGLSYLAAQRTVPFYGGGMSSAKAALESDARTLAWFAGERSVRVNVISAGPYASRAAKSIGDIEHMVNTTTPKSPLRRPITPEQVANAALFLCSGMAEGITGEVIFVDAGFHAMAGLDLPVPSETPPHEVG